MNEISTWIRSGRDYMEGLEIYHKHKRSTKHDKFLNTENPSLLHKNMLYSQMLRLQYKVTTRPNVQPKTTPEKITVKKINPLAKAKAADPAPSRNNKVYINKLLALNWNELTYADKAIFDHSERIFLDKKSVFIENSDLMRDMQSMHAKMRSLPKNANDERAALLDKIAAAEEKKDENWKYIDNWEDKAPAKSNPMAAVEDELTKLKNEKLIKQHKIYIYRAENTIAGLPDKTKSDKKRIEKSKKEVERRKQILVELGSPYKRTDKAKQKIKK